MTARGKATAQLVFGSALESISARAARGYTSAKAKMLWGRGRSKRASEMVHFLLDPAHRLHGELAPAYEVVVTLSRFLGGDANAQPLLGKIIEARANSDASMVGDQFPAKRLMDGQPRSSWGRDQ